MKMMKAITIQQYWAWAIMAGHKGVENRTWGTSYRGPLAIHAGQSISLMSRQIIQRILGRDVPVDCPRGALLGVVDLVDVVRFNPHQPLLLDPYDLAGDPFATGPVCWILRNPRALAEPIPMRGQLGLFEVADLLGTAFVAG